MARTRIELQEKFEELLGSRNVYFQPPESIKLKFPCIIYNLSSMQNNNADDMPYIKNKRWFVTIVDKDPESDIYERMIDEFQMCTLDRTGVVDNLNHWYLTLFW